MKLPIPSAAIEQHIVALGKTGRGKSSALRGGFVEPLLDSHEPVCILDPKGDWWGLKSSADGRSAGYSVVIFGGEHADVPINEHSGGHIAELVATGNRPCIIDLGGWMIGERTRFFIAFASTLFKHTRGRRWLVIDECHNFAPQGKVLDVDAGKMLHWANRLASEGRGKGINIIAASQRPQKVHKDFLTSMETLIAMGVVHKLDRDAVKDWIDGCADPATGKEVMATLAGLPRGEAWVWSPEIDFGPKRIKFPFFRTYDSFKAQAADAGKLKGWAEVDLDDVRTKLQSVVDEAKANDPAELRKRIRELERQVAAKGPTTGVADVEAAERRGFDRGCLAGVEAQKALLSKITFDFETAEASFSATFLSALNAARPENPERRGLTPSRPAVAAPRAEPNRIRADGARSQRQIDGRAASGEPLPKAERALLTVLAQHPAGRTRVQLSLLSGYSIKSSSFANALGALRSAGHINRDEPIRITAEGESALGSWEPLPTGSALIHHWMQNLGLAERRMLEVLVANRPNSMSKEQLSEASGYSLSSSSFANALGRLRSLELVNRGPDLLVTEDLF